MQTLNTRHAVHRGCGRFRDVAWFDAPVMDSLRLADLPLVEAPNGRRVVYAPSKNAKHFASSSAEFAHPIATAAIAAMTGGCGE